MEKIKLVGNEKNMKNKLVGNEKNNRNQNLYL